MPLKIKEAPPIVEDVAPAAGFKAAPRLSAAGTDAKATALKDDAPSWHDTCGICLDLLPASCRTTFYECCCKSICTVCYNKCREYDDRCPLCRAFASASNAEWLRRVQKHADEGKAKAQLQLGYEYRDGGSGLKKSLKRAVQWYERAAARGHAPSQNSLGLCYELGDGVKIDHKTAAQLFQRAAEQGLSEAQYNLGGLFAEGKGVSQSFDEAMKWWRLAAAQGDAESLYNLGICYANGQGAPRDDHEALHFFKRAATQGCAGAAAAVEELAARVAATRAGPPT